MPVLIFTWSYLLKYTLQSSTSITSYVDTYVETMIWNDKKLFNSACNMDELKCKIIHVQWGLHTWFATSAILREIQLWNVGRNCKTLCAHMHSFSYINVTIFIHLWKVWEKKEQSIFFTPTLFSINQDRNIILFR